MPIDQKKFYVTTPIYYANAKPHLGTLYSTILADAVCRYKKLHGYDTFLLTGTDEHGQKIAQAAQEAGISPRAIVDAHVHEFKKLWSLYTVDYNHFIRTTDEYHVKGVQAWIERLTAKGDIYKGVYTGWYCVPCETFVAEKESGVTVKAIECVSCKRPTVELSEECYFFRLSAYQQRLLDFYREHAHFITPAERLHEVVSFVESGLKDLCISRTTVTWGIPFPNDERHKVYVWADALNNYITAIGYNDPQKQEDFGKWWPADVQVMGKDIVRFHAVYWPAFLMASELDLPHQLLVHGWIIVGQQKMSKSLGNAIDPFALANSYGADSIRYYLLRHTAITQDSPFSIEDLEKRLNSDLAHDLGNLLNRMATLALKYNNTTINAPAQLAGAELELRGKLWSMINDFSSDMEEYYFHRAYAHVWKFINHANAYFHSQEPWKVAQHDPERFNNILSAVCHSLYAIAILAWPLMPTKMSELLASLGCSLELGTNLVEKLSFDPWLKTFTLAQIPPLFKKYEIATPAELPTPTAATISSPSSSGSSSTTDKSSTTITIADLSKVQLCVGTVMTCQEIAKSDKLYKLDVNFGPHGTRQIVSGVRQHFTPEDLIGKQGVFVLNLQPRMMLGHESQGMMLFVEKSDGKLTMVTVGDQVPDGNSLR